MVDIGKAIANDQFGDVNYIAHEIKDVAGNLGGMELMKRLSKFGAACPSAQPTGIEDALLLCMIHFESLESVFRQYTEMFDLNSCGFKFTP